jgi:hypothetical protein
MVLRLSFGAIPFFIDFRCWSRDVSTAIVKNIGSFKCSHERVFYPFAVIFSRLTTLIQDDTLMNE